ncbi:MAG: DUF4314 domain-containing protein [Anaerococcus sp.]|nr:DUF4314 domain-containing protein [Anaerococcus sp.]
MISREMIKMLSDVYPKSTRIKLLQMDDQGATPLGRLGTVRGVDDIGSILVKWGDGSNLNVIFGVDEVEIIPDKA